MGKYFADVHEGPGSQLGNLPETVRDTEDIERMKRELPGMEDKDLRYEALVQLAKALIHQLRYKSALIYLDQAINLLPQRTEALRMRAIRRLYTLDLKGSLGDFLHLREVNYGDVSYQLGLDYYLLGDYGKCLKEMEVCYGLSDNEMKIAAMYWHSAAALRCGARPSLLDFYSDDFECGHHTFYKAACAMFAGRRSFEELKVLSEGEKSDLEYSMLAYALHIIESVKGREKESREILQSIVKRDSFWIGFAYVAAWNDLYGGRA